MEIEINGKVQLLPHSMSLSEYLNKESILPERIACELNGKIIRRKDLGSTVLKPGDVLEVITIVGGG